MLHAKARQPPQKEAIVRQRKKINSFVISFYIRCLEWKCQINNMSTITFNAYSSVHINGSKIVYRTGVTQFLTASRSLKTDYFTFLQENQTLIAEYIINQFLLTRCQKKPHQQDYDKLKENRLIINSTIGL